LIELFPSLSLFKVFGKQISAGVCAECNNLPRL
jgi:hypothetical protein